MTHEEIRQRIEDGLHRLSADAAPQYEDDGEPRIRLSLSRLRSCPRQLIFSFMTGDAGIVDDEREDKGWGVMVAGIWWEEFLAKYVFTDFERQCRVNLMGIWGHCDFLRHTPETGQVTVLEIKTRHEIPDIPLPNHYTQLNAYMLGIRDNGYWLRDGTHVTENINDIEGFLVYVNRDNPADFGVFHFPQADENVRQIVSKMKDYVDDFLTNDVVPPIPSDYQPFKFPCFIETRYDTRICPFHATCWRRFREGGEDISPVITEGFRRWLAYKDSEENYKRFVDYFIRPLFANLEKSAAHPVTYLNEAGIFRAVPRRGHRRLDVNILRRGIERITGRQFSEEEWKSICDEAMVEGEGSVAIEFRKVRG